MNIEEFNKEVKIAFSIIGIIFSVYFIFEYLNILNFWFGTLYGISLVHIYKLIRNKYE